VALVQYTYTKNNTENDTKQTIHTTTKKLGRVRAVPRLCGFTTEKKAWKTSVRLVIHKHTIRIHNHNNKNT